jgi:hemerythrin-like metal-binding protein
MEKQIEWKSAYNLGDGGLDDEHAEWVRLANRVIRAVDHDAPAADLNEAFCELLDCTVRHFDVEERHMEGAYYPELARHRGLHDRHIRDLVRFQGRCKRREVKAEAVATYLLDWLLEHILQADADYVPYVKGRTKP